MKIKNVTFLFIVTSIILSISFNSLFSQFNLNDLPLTVKKKSSFTFILKENDHIKRTINEFKTISLKVILDKPNQSLMINKYNNKYFSNLELKNIESNKKDNNNVFLFTMKPIKYGETLISFDKVGKDYYQNIISIKFNIISNKTKLNNYVINNQVKENYQFIQDIISSNIYKQAMVKILDFKKKISKDKSNYNDNKSYYYNLVNSLFERYLEKKEYVEANDFIDKILKDLNKEDIKFKLFLLLKKIYLKKENGQFLEALKLSDSLVFENFYLDIYKENLFLRGSIFLKMGNPLSARNNYNKYISIIKVEEKTNIKDYVNYLEALFFIGNSYELETSLDYLKAYKTYNTYNEVFKKIRGSIEEKSYIWENLSEAEKNNIKIMTKKVNDKKYFY